MARKPKVVYFTPKFLEILKANTYMSPELIAHLRSTGVWFE